MGLISRFDPWRSGLCTCPFKLTFNPYTGCDHACTYCYASSYVPRFSDCRPKKDLVERLKHDAEGLKGQTLSVSNSSDPYPSLDGETGLTRRCLEILCQHDCRLQIVTKSPLVTRDIDLLTAVPSMVSVTVTSSDDNVALLIEPGAPLASERLRSVERLIEKGIPTSVRVDPVIPFVNDNQESLMEVLASLGVKHVTSSTLKIKPDGWQRLCARLLEVAEKLKPLFFEHDEMISGNRYLPRRQVRFDGKNARSS